MSLFNIFNISGSALNAQTLRLNTTASNMANANSASSSSGKTYRAREPVFEPMLSDALDPNGAADAGVKVMGIVESQAPLRHEYQPGSPLADADVMSICPTSTSSKRWRT